MTCPEQEGEYFFNFQEFFQFLNAALDPPLVQKFRMTSIKRSLRLLLVWVSLYIQGKNALTATRSYLSHVNVGTPSPCKASRTQLHSTIPSRRSWILDLSRTVAVSSFSVSIGTSSWPSQVFANEEQFNPDDPEFKDLYDKSKANIPSAPEERSGLVVLRVAEVSQFQEKILRAIVSGDLKDVMVSPMQFAFGTQILLRNSNLDGNMKLMIQEEIPRQKRAEARKNAANVMNTLQSIAKYSASIQRDFEPIEMIELADMYTVVRANLNQLYEYLPDKEREKYYGYFVAVTEYEKKIANGMSACFVSVTLCCILLLNGGTKTLLTFLTLAYNGRTFNNNLFEGTYNPDIDGVLKFD